MQTYKVTVDKNGTERWYNENGKRHREGDKPAVEFANGDKIWYKNDKLHREGDKPAAIYVNGDKYWYKDGQFHRDGDKPAIERANGTKEYWKDGERVPDPTLVKELTVAEISKLLGYEVKIVK